MLLIYNKMDEYAIFTCLSVFFYCQKTEMTYITLCRAYRKMIVYTNEDDSFAVKVTD